MPQSGCFIIQLPRRVLRVYWLRYLLGSVFPVSVSGASSLVYSGLKRLVVDFKINAQKNNWPQKTCKPLSNTFPSSNWSVTVMRIDQSLWSEFMIRYESQNLGCFWPDLRPQRICDFLADLKTISRKINPPSFHACRRLSVGGIWKILIFDHVPHIFYMAWS